jgi:hypothetical protein
MGFFAPCRRQGAHEGHRREHEHISTGTILSGLISANRPGILVGSDPLQTVLQKCQPRKQSQPPRCDSEGGYSTLFKSVIASDKVLLKPALERIFRGLAEFSLRLANSAISLSSS